MSKFQFLMGQRLASMDSRYWLDKYDIHRVALGHKFPVFAGFSEGINHIESQCSNDEPIHIFVSMSMMSKLYDEFRNTVFVQRMPKSQWTIFGIPIMPHIDLNDGDTLFVRTSWTIKPDPGSLRSHVIRSCSPRDVYLWRDGEV